MTAASELCYSNLLLDAAHLQILEQMSSQYQASYIEAKAEYNVKKNRFPDKLPS